MTSRLPGKLWLVGQPRAINSGRLYRKDTVVKWLEPAEVAALVAQRDELKAQRNELLVACKKLLFNALHGNGLETHYEAQEKAAAAIEHAERGAS